MDAMIQLGGDIHAKHITRHDRTRETVRQCRWRAACTPPGQGNADYMLRTGADGEGRPHLGMTAGLAQAQQRQPHLLHLVVRQLPVQGRAVGGSVR